MNEEIRFIANDWKTARNELENDDSNFLWALYSVYKESRTIFFHALLAMYRSVASYEYFTKLMSEVWKH